MKNCIIWIKYRFLLFVQESSTHLDKYRFLLFVQESSTHLDKSRFCILYQLKNLMNAKNELFEQTTHFLYLIYLASCFEQTTHFYA